MFHFYLARPVRWFSLALFAAATLGVQRATSVPPPPPKYEPAEPTPLPDPPDEPPGGGCPPGDPCCNNPDPCCEPTGPCCGVNCNDNDPCTNDACVNGECEYTPVPCCGIDCDDGDPCTLDRCENGSCRYSPKVCNDYNPCTNDSCGPAGCQFTPKNCSDQNPCTLDHCNQATGECWSEYNGSPDDIDCDGIPNKNDPDIDGDGIPNGNDSDVDGDGIPNGQDGDIDGDGIPNGQDSDDDGDGQTDSNDDDPQGCEDGDPCCGSPDPCCSDPEAEPCCYNGSSDPCCNNPSECCGSTDPCCGSTDPCCGSSDPCCGSTDPCCADPDPCCPYTNPCCGIYCDDGNPCTIDTCYPPTGQCVYLPVSTCQSNGSLSGGDITMESACLGESVKFSVSGVADSGGTACTGGIPAVEPSYTWVITRPDTTTEQGTGAMAETNADQPGEYSCTFTASVARQCPPPTRTIGPETTTAVKVDLDGDADHDGDVESDGLDDEDEDIRFGVIVLCNNDDDDGDHVPDLENARVDNFADASDLNRLVLRRIEELPEGWKIRLVLHSEELVAAGVTAANVVRVFANNLAGNDSIAILGGTGTAPASWELPEVAPNNGVGIDTLAQADVNLWFEGLIPAAKVKLSVEIEDDTNQIVCDDQLQLKVTPFILLPNTAPAAKVVVANTDFDFCGAISALAGAGNVINPGPSDQWTQDAWEFGYSSCPFGATPKVVQQMFETQRPNWLQGWGRENLLGPTTADDKCGLTKQIGNVDPVLKDQPYAFGGNIDVTPPLPGFPLGRIVVGTMTPYQQLNQRSFLNRQRVQAPDIFVDTSWLNAGHVDEVMAFAPDSTGSGWRLVLPNTYRAFELLGSAPPDLPLFYCNDDAQWASGEATGGTANTLVDDHPGVDFTTENWQWVRIYDGAAKFQVGEISDRTANTITISRSWRFETSLQLFLAITGDSRHDDYFSDTGWEFGEIPQGPNPQGASKYVLLSCSKQWTDASFRLFPAFTTVHELRSDDNALLRNLNAEAQNRIAPDSFFNELQGANFDLAYVPAIYLAETHEQTGALIDETAFAYIPGLVNLQVWRSGSAPAQIWLPKPFGPKVNGVDIFAMDAASELSVPGGVFFIDDWNIYHRLKGEVHCGTNVIRMAPADDQYRRWWDHTSP